MINYDARIDEIIEQLMLAKEDVNKSLEVELSIASNMLDHLIIDLGG
jgi:hypothetical protein